MLLLCKLKVLLTRQNFAFENENLYSYEAVCCHCLSKTVVDISAKCMERNPAFTIPLGAGHLCAAKTAGTGDPDTFCPEFERRSNALFHGTSESNSTFQLKCNILSNKLRIKFRLANFMDVDENLFGSERRKLFLYCFNFRPFFTNDKTWSGGMNVDLGFIGSTLDLYL